MNIRLIFYERFSNLVITHVNLILVIKLSNDNMQ